MNYCQPSVQNLSLVSFQAHILVYIKIIDFQMESLEKEFVPIFEFCLRSTTQAPCGYKVRFLLRYATWLTESISRDFQDKKAAW